MTEIQVQHIARLARAYIRESVNPSIMAWEDHQLKLQKCGRKLLQKWNHWIGDTNAD
jgi:hypothetical protein